jgi:flagellar protein FlbD
MIELTRLNGNKIMVNCDLIRYVEASPDTVLTLVTGEKLIVLENCNIVTTLAFQYRVALLKGTWPDVSGARVARAAFDATHADHKTFFDRE